MGIRKNKKANMFFQEFFFININAALFGMFFITRIILISNNICFITIQNGSMSQAWTEVYHQVFDGWERKSGEI